jgi:predicted site-specific integrase-resolvase
MKKSAAIYARVSSERQKEEGTIASQTALLLEYASAHELSVPREWIFEDEGYSGATLARPGLERLRDLAAEGQIEVALIYAPDRLSRRYAYQVLLIEELSRHGVETVFLKSAAAETPEERLMLQFQGMIAEYERAQIAERTLVKQITVGKDLVTIHHSIPIGAGGGSGKLPSYPLCTTGHRSALRPAFLAPLHHSLDHHSRSQVAPD